MMRIGFFVFLLTVSASTLWSEMISDVSGYVTLTATDPGGTHSFSSNTGRWSNKLAPTNGFDYLIQGARVLRTPEMSTAEHTFQGDSLTLDNGNMNLKHANTNVHIEDFRLYSCQVAQGVGPSWMWVSGKMRIFPSAMGPTAFSGSANGGMRVLVIQSEITGDADARILVKRTPSDGDDLPGSRFYCCFTGTNTAYQGRFTTTGNDINLVAENLRNLGPGDRDGVSFLTLTDQGGFYGDRLWFTNQNYSVTLEDDCVIGGFKHRDYEPSISMVVDGGVTLKGAGRLRISSFERARIQLGEVNLPGVTNLYTRNSCVEFTPDFVHPELPILFEGSGCVSGTSQDLGDVTLAGDAWIAPVYGGLGTLGMASLTMTENSFLRYGMTTNGAGAVTSDFIRVKGSLSKSSDMEKIRILIEDYPINVENPFTARILSAANLGTPDGLTVDDFVVEALSENPIHQKILAGEFSIEEEDGVRYLRFTRTSRPLVALKGMDNTDSSFAKAGYWSNGKAPSAEYDYCVTGGSLLRARANGTFAGHSLSIADGGDMAVNGVTATVNDLRMFKNGVITVRNDGSANVLCGTGTVYGTFFYQIEAVNSLRELKHNLVWKGDGKIVLCYYAGWNPTKTKTALYSILSESPEYKGKMEIRDGAIVADFKNQLAMGGPADAFSDSRLVLTNGATIRASSSYVMDDPTRGVRIDAGGGNFEILTNCVLTLCNPVSGLGELRKKGPGELILSGENRYTGATELQEGMLTLASAQAVQKSQIHYAAGTVLQIATPEGVALSGPDALVCAEETAVPCTVQVAAFEQAVDVGSATAELFTIPGASTFDTGTIDVDPGALKGKCRVEVLTEGTSDGLRVYAKATIRSTLLMLR